MNASASSKQLPGTHESMRHEPALTHIVKRDGRKVPFESAKLLQALFKASAATKEFDGKEAERLAQIVQDILKKVIGIRKTFVTVEQVQDTVEQVLMAAGHFQTAKAYILYRAEHTKIRNIETVIGVENDLGLTVNQLKVIEKRFLLHDMHGKAAETPSQMFTRVARTLANVEKKSQQKKFEQAFYAVMASLEFLPAGRTLNNAGTPQNQLASCFVLPIGDSMEGIFDSVKWTAMVHQRGGGTGFDFTPLRPRGDVVSKSSGGFATGPVSFMKVFDTATRQVMQGGKLRGANMGILAADHPDILEFITCKTEEGEISNFNISVGASDTFMKAVEKDAEMALRNPRDGQVVQKISARMLMDQIVSLAWRTGDPGMIYWDTINANNPLRESQGEITATNPCVVGDTLVETPTGLKKVAEIHIGDEIYTVDGVGVVDEIEIHEDAEIFRVEFENGTVVQATAAHQLFAQKNDKQNSGFSPVRLDQLTIDDTVQTFNTETKKQDGYARIISITPAGFSKVYDLHEPKSDTWITNGVVSRGCGEQPLHPFDACNLGSINLAKFAIADEKPNDAGDTVAKKQSKKKQKPEDLINWKRLEEVTHIAVRMLDNVITACSYPLPQIAETVKKNRRIGLGVMGWADLLLQLGVAYNSDEGVALAEKVMGFIQRASWDESERLAKEKGAFPRWKESWFARGYDPISHTYKNKKSPRQFRNVAITTIAPTGTISMAAECSSGIEPVFALCYVKNVVESEGLTYVNKHFEHALKDAVGHNGVFHELISEIAETGSAQHVDDVPLPLKKVFVTAHDIDWKWHVKMQAAFQKHTDNAVSKTINMPADASLEEVRGAYLLAWKLGCKGITVYRDSSRSGQVLSVAVDASKKSSDDPKTKKKEVLIQSKMVAVPLAERKDFHTVTKKQIEEHAVLQERRQTRNDETCPECGGTMQSTEGCSLCPSCGYSKCKL